MPLFLLGLPVLSPGPPKLKHATLSTLNFASWKICPRLETKVDHHAIADELPTEYLHSRCGGLGGRKLGSQTAYKSLHTPLQYLYFTVVSIFFSIIPAKVVFGMQT